MPLRRNDVIALAHAALASHDPDKGAAVVGRPSLQVVDARDEEAGTIEPHSLGGGPSPSITRTDQRRDTSARPTLSAGGVAVELVSDPSRDRETDRRSGRSRRRPITAEREDQRRPRQASECRDRGAMRASTTTSPDLARGDVAADGQPQRGAAEGAAAPVGQAAAAHGAP